MRRDVTSCMHDGDHCQKSHKFKDQLTQLLRFIIDHHYTPSTITFQLSDEAFLRGKVLDGGVAVIKPLASNGDKPGDHNQKAALLADVNVAVNSKKVAAESEKVALPFSLSTLKDVATTSKLGLDTILLIICSNRPEYLKRTLEHVLRYHPR